MERVTPQNLMFLAADNETQRLHVGSVGRYEGPAPTLEVLAERVERALHLVPRGRQRLVDVPFGFSRPVWVDDLGFAIDQHVFDGQLVPTAHQREEEALHARVGEIMSAPLSRDRPLWEMHIVRGLGDDSWALVTKTHQAMVDGVAGTPLLAVLLDLTPEPRAFPDVEWRPRDEPSDLRLLSDAVSDLAVDPREMGRVVAAGLRLQTSAFRWIAGAFGGNRSVVSDPTGLCGPVSASRGWAAGSVALSTVRELRERAGVSVNDVVLAIIGGGLRAFLLARGDLEADLMLRVAVPISVGDGDRYENEVTVVSYDVPVGLEDPLERLTSIAEQSSELVDRGVAADVLRTLAGNPSARLLALGSRMATLAVRHQRTYHAIALNVPGPDQDRFLLGRRMLSNHPVVPLVDGVRAAVGALSWGDEVHFGVTVDQPLAVDLGAMTRGFQSAVAELATATRAVAAPTTS